MTMQIISTTIIQLEEVFHIHLVSALHYVINSYINLVQNLGGRQGDALR